MERDYRTDTSDFAYSTRTNKSFARLGASSSASTIPSRTKDAHRDSYASNSLSSSSTTRLITNLPSLWLGPVLGHSTDCANLTPTPMGSMISPAPLLPVRRPNEPKAVRQRVPPTTTVNAASSSSSNSSKSDRRSRNTRSTSSVVQFPSLTHTTLGGGPRRKLS